MDTSDLWGVTLQDSRATDPAVRLQDLPTEVGERIQALGARYGSYELERQLGVGGMGEVYAAHHVDTGERVALKTLAKADATLRYRFKREFRALADVEHRNLVRLGELVVTETGPSYFTMELLDGENFVKWVRRDAKKDEIPDISRLEAGLQQLVHGLECLHANQCVHRDLKSSNVMVTEAGRVVILDFGIISELDTGGVTQIGQVVGTPVYMAPEQALGARVGPAADYYSVGVMLYECLTGRQPLVGPALVVLVDKQIEQTPDPGLDNAVPTRLRELCVRLLHRDPARRPTGSEILVRLGLKADESTSRVRSSATFVGRQRELAVLRQGLADAQALGRTIAVHLRGRAGQGKSTLIHQFLAQTGCSGLFVVLRGRCRERESVPYKGVDAVVDALSVHLRRLDTEERSALKPRHLGPLVRMFPVLDEVWPRDGIGPSGRDAGHGPHDDEVRQLGCAALREVLTRLAGRRPLLVAIDDFQWADLDSVALLRALSRPQDSPAMLLLVAFRSEAEESEVVRELAAGGEFGDVRRLDLPDFTVGPEPKPVTRPASGRPAIEYSEESIVVVRKDLGDARSLAREACNRIGLSGFPAQKLVTAVSELARNIAHYVGEGEVRFRVDLDRQRIVVIAEDHGRGIPNLDEIMTGNYRSKTGLGRGLIGVRKLADEFEIQTGPGGTTVQIAFHFP